MSDFDPFTGVEQPRPQGPKRRPGPNDESAGYDGESAPGGAEDGPASAEAPPLPDDIERVWGQGRLDGNGMLAADTARFLIGEWGVERFRASALHRAAASAVLADRAKQDARHDFRSRDLPKR